MANPASNERTSLRLMPRREFLRTTAVGAAGTVATLTIDPTEALAAGVPAERVRRWMAQAASATPEAMAAYEPQALSVAELATLRAAVGRLIPTDDLGPGADEAGVHIFIDQTLAGPDAATLPLYQGGLDVLDEAAGEGGFAEADSGTQDEILAAVEAGLAPGSATPVAATPASAATNPQMLELASQAPEGFFAMLLEHTRQGMFGDPIYGGNANFVGWDLIGYPGIKLVWTEEEQEIDAVVVSEHISVEKYGGTGHE